VICLPPYDTVKANWTEKRKAAWDPAKGTGDYVDAAHKLSLIYQNYKFLVETGHYIRFNYLKDSVKKVLGE